MIVLEFKLTGATSQYAALDEAIRTTQFIRTHVCPQCKTVLDRDHNAARNILALGLRALEETTAGHAESHAWGQLDASPVDTAAG
jgi:transposase